MQKTPTTTEIMKLLTFFKQMTGLQSNSLGYYSEITITPDQLNWYDISFINSYLALTSNKTKLWQKRSDVFGTRHI